MKRDVQDPMSDVHDSSDTDLASSGSVSERRLELALSAGHMGTWEWNIRTGSVVWSAALERIHGIPEGSFPGTFEAYRRDIHPGDRERVLASISAAVEGRAPHQLAYRIVRPDGEVRWLEASGQVLYGAGGDPELMLGVCGDVTARRTALERLAVLTELGQRFAEKATDPQGLACAIAEEVGTKLGDACSVLLLEPGGTTLNLAALYDVDPDAVAYLRKLIADHPPAVGEGVAGRVVASNQTVHIPLVDQAKLAASLEPRHRPWLERFAAHSLLGVPLRARGAVIGALMASRHRTPYPYSAGDRALLEALADSAGLALDNARLYEAARREHAEAERARGREAFLARVSAVLGSSFDDKRSLDAIARLTLPEVADYCVLFDARGAILTLAHRDPEQEAELARAAGLVLSGPLLHGLEGAQSILVSELSQELTERHLPELEQRALVASLQIRSLLVVPIVARGRQFGFLHLAMTTSGRRFEQADQALAEAIGRRAGLVIDNARLFEAERRARQEAELASSEAETLYRLADAANRSGSVEELYEASLDAIERALGIERAAILLLEGERGMRFKAWRGLSERYRAAVEGHTPWQAGDPRPEPIFVPSVAQDPALAGFAALFLSEGIGALAFVPLIYESRLLGKFMLYCNEPTQFSARQARVSLSIADQIASGIGRRFGAQERERLIDRLSETVRLNERFAAVLGHDLRNPLSAIVTGAQILERQAKDATVVRTARRILSSSDRMTRMISQLLDFARIRAGGGFPVQPRPTDLCAVCRELLEEFEHSAHRHVSFEHTGHLQGLWDPDRLAQVISNLLGNAAQHGSPEWPVRLRLDGTSAESVTLSVTSGGEIPAELLEGLFDPFRSTRLRHTGGQGLGLGLYITQQIVVAHRGTIQVLSSRGETTMLVTLPRKSAG